MPAAKSPTATERLASKVLLFAVKTHDPLIFGAMVFGIALVGVLANLVPAWRAARVDPTRALRFE